MKYIEIQINQKLEKGKKKKKGTEKQNDTRKEL